MAVRIQFRRGTAAEWTSANPTLAAGELGYETDTAKFKLGDGANTWSSLDYAGINQDDINAAIANVIDSAPGALDTLNELAAAINDDANFFTTISGNIANAESNAISYTNTYVSDYSNVTTNIHGIADTADLVVSGDLVGLATESYVANAVSQHDQDTTNVHGISNTANLAYSADVTLEIDGAISVHEAVTTNVHGIANTADLVVTSDLTSAITAHDLETVNVHGIADTSDLVVTSALSSAVSTHNGETLNVHGIANTALLVLQGDLSDAVLAHTNDTTGIHGIDNTAELVTNTSLSTTLADYATLESPTFTGTVSLPTGTTIGDISGTELGHLDNVSSNIQDQLDAKLDSSSAASIYAPIASPDFTGNVVFSNAESLTIPANSNFDIAGLDGMQISTYLADIDRNVKQRLDNAFYYDESTDPLPMIGIGNVTYTQLSTLDGVDTANVTSTEINYLAGATSNLQTQLDAKAALAGATFTGAVEAPDVTITGNLIVQGTTTTISTSNLKLQDNMVYLNQAGLATVTDATGDGTNVVYTTEDAHGFEVGYFVTVANTTPSSFDFDSDGLEIIAVTSNTFTVASTVTDTYVSGGTARGKVHSNPDLGWAAGRYADNTYAHAGVFRDATDGVFKFFDGYVPEPDESVFIDTSANTFALAPIQASEVTAANLIATTGIVFPDNTIQTSAGVASLTGFTEKTASYTLDTLDHKDNVVEMNSGSALTFTIPTNSTLEWPIGASMDIIQTGAGQVTIANAVGVTLNYTPGNKLRTQWSSCTIMKRGTDSWILYGDLTA
jgi:hypothetical protein